MLFHTVTMVVLVSTVTTITQRVERPRLTDQVRQHGSLEYMVINEYSPVELGDLVASADAIVEGTIGQVESFLSEDETRVLTDYKVVVTRVLKPLRAEGTPEGKTITVRRPGGIITIDGHTVRANESDFPPFQRGDRYVLFLKLGRSAYEVSYGGQGAFKTVGNAVSQASRAFGTWNAKHGTVSLEQFRALVRSLQDQGACSTRRGATSGGLAPWGLHGPPAGRDSPGDGSQP